MLVSVIIPCYNVENYIEECLLSVFYQSYSNLEVICVDNNSTDNTYSKLKELRTDKHPELIILSEKIKGASAARNTGLKVAKGEWIQFLDADDLLCENKIYGQVRLVNGYENLGFIVSGYKKRKINGREEFVRVSKDKFTAAFINQSGITSSNLWCKNHLIDINAWDQSLQSSQETDLMFRLILNGSECQYEETINTIVRERASGQISQSDPSARWKQYISVRTKYVQNLAKKYPNVYQEKSQIFLNYLFASTLVLLKYDQNAAIEYYSSYLKDKWQPNGGFGVSKIKAMIVKLFGMKLFRLFQLVFRKY